MQKFNLDRRILEDYYSADYFVKTKEIINKYKPDQIITMQWFQRGNDVVFCGVEIVIELLKMNGTFDKLEILSLNDGDIINNMEPVLKITGKYSEFAHLEGVIDGILSRATTIATNVRNLIKIANGKQILNMNDRADLYSNQQVDGYASYIGGVSAMVTPASFEYINPELAKELSGTMPHALIQAFDGDLIHALHAYQDTFPNNNLVALVDYNNDCVTDALKAAKEFNKDLYAIRLDTAKNLIDKSLQDRGDLPELHGVNPTLVKLVRQTLDDNGYQHVKIIVSSSFNKDKIAMFENEKAPVDMYGVGEAITLNKIGFTGDAVLVDGKPQAKFGRENFESKRIKLVK